MDQRVKRITERVSEMNVEEERILWMDALRYNIGKDQGYIKEFCNILIAEWDRLSIIVRSDIIDCIEDEYCLDDIERKRYPSRFFYKLGTTDDREEWDRVRELWKKKVVDATNN